MMKLLLCHECAVKSSCPKYCPFGIPALTPCVSVSTFPKPQTPVSVQEKHGANNCTGEYNANEAIPTCKSATK